MYFVFISTTSNLKCFLCVITAFKCFKLHGYYGNGRTRENRKKKTHLVTSWSIYEAIVNAIYYTDTYITIYHSTFSNMGNLCFFFFGSSFFHNIISVITASGARGLDDITIKWFNDFDVGPEIWLFLWALLPLF